MRRRTVTREAGPGGTTGRARNPFRTPDRSLPPAGSSALSPGRSSPPGAGRGGSGHAPSGALFRSRGPDSAAGIVAKCHWIDTGGRLSSGSFSRCVGAGGGEVAAQYPRGMNVAPIGIFASGRVPLVKRCGERSARGPAPASSRGRLRRTAVAPGAMRTGRLRAAVDDQFQWPSLELPTGGAAPRSHLTPQCILRGCAPVETRGARP